MKEQKEEAERFQQKLKEMEDLKIESFLVQLFHINRVCSRDGARAMKPFEVCLDTVYQVIYAQQKWRSAG